MAEKILKTRIQLRYDTLTNWTTNNPVLKAGEIAIVTISTAVPADKQLPPVMFKVGTYDGVTEATKKKFNDLDWASALAADVYDWAKKSGIEVNTSGTGKVVTDIAWDATNKRLNVTKGDVDLSGYVPTSRTIAGVDLKDNVTKAELLTALNVADGATKVTTDTVAGWGYTKNTGTVTGVKMNGTTKSPTSGVVDLGTVITSHQSLDGKQDKLTAGQLAAVNSGITADKVEAYDGYADTISGKQDALNPTQMNAVNSGITSTLVTKYNGYEATISGKQDKITSSNKLAASLVSGLATVATSGSYNDLTDKPTIPTMPTVHDAALKDTSGQTIFTADASEDVKILVINCGDSSDTW